MRLSKFPEIRIPGTRRPQIAIALERFKSEVTWADSHDGRAIIRILEPVVQKATRKAAALLKRKVDSKAVFALPKAASVQAIKAGISEELDVLSHRVAFALTPGMDPVSKVGPCFTCGSITVLQWGHFVSQADCPFLVYHEHNTRGQCGTCNGLRQGAYREFRAALEAECPGRAEAVEALAAKYGKKRPRAHDLTEQLHSLKAFAEKKGIA